MRFVLSDFIPIFTLKMTQVPANGYPLVGGLPLQLISLGIVVIGLFVYWYLYSSDLHPGIPVVGMDNKAWFKYEKARQNYIANGKSLVEMGVKQVIAT